MTDLRVMARDNDDILGWSGRGLWFGEMRVVMMQDLPPF